MDGEVNEEVDIRLEYWAAEDDTVQLTYVVQVEDRDTKLLYEAFIDAHNGALVSTTDFNADATVSRSSFYIHPTLTTP